MYYFVCMLFLMVFNTYTMQDRLQKTQDQNFLLWQQYKPTVREVAVNQSMITKIDGYKNICAFFCQFQKESNHELCIVKAETIRSMTPSYGFSICKCAWDKCYASRSSEDLYFCDINSGDLKPCDNLPLYYLFADPDRDISKKAQKLRSLCVQLAQEQKMLYGDINYYEVSKDYSKVIWIAPTGVIYCFTPGAWVAMNLSKKQADLYFRFK